MSDETLQLDALKCQQCGASVPLGESDHAYCANCRTETPIPPQYLELRKLRRWDSYQRHAAEVLLQRLDRPASMFTKVVARVFDQPMFGFWLLYGVPVILFGIYCTFVMTRYWAKHHGYRSADDVPSWLAYLFGSSVVFVICMVPRIFGIYASRRAKGRARLLAGMQAKAPSNPGGPSRCRFCGAPLEVAKGQLVAHCLYCQTDSVLEVRTAIVGETRGVVTNSGRAIADAVSLDQKDRTRIRQTVGSEFRRYVLLTLGFVIPLCVWGWDYDRNRASGATPVWGLCALVFITFYLIGGMLFSMVGKSSFEREQQLKWSGNDVPSWVGWGGPLAFWVVLYSTLRWVIPAIGNHHHG